ncbi:HAD hydrolase-like protein, partial [Klebsiella pneumoniae]|uniref:HAD hydrolase-like protein n=1 Tax=Klebsiella pneumoniae TaxID=573 RepID=UPI0032AFAE51
MYEGYAGLIFDMDGTILDTEPTHRQAWNEVLGRYGMRFDEQAMVALNGSPTWRIAQAIIELNQADLDPHRLAQEKTQAVKAMLLDSVRPLPLIEVVKAWHGRRPMSVVVKFFWTRRSDGRVMHRRATGRQGWPAFRTVRVMGSQV